MNERSWVVNMISKITAVETQTEKHTKDHSRNHTKPKVKQALRREVKVKVPESKMAQHRNGQLRGP